MTADERVVDWDETTRPTRARPDAEVSHSRLGRAVGQHLVQIHDHLREELARVRDVVDQVRAGRVSAAAARSAVNDMSMRQNDWTMGAYCASYCRLVTQHHGIEDAAVFPHLREGDPSLTPVLNRLEDEHVLIHGLLDDLDRALVDHIRTPGDSAAVLAAVDLLSDRLPSHLSYEEHELLDPLARLGFYPGQL